MRNIFLAFFMMFCGAAYAGQSGFHILHAASEKNDPLFAGASDSVGLYFGMGLRNCQIYPDFTKPAPFGMAMIEYGQPMTFFRLPAKYSFHIGYTQGFDDNYKGEDWVDYSWPMGGISLETVLMSWGDFYGGAGLGMFMKWKVDERQDSRFIFGLKGFIGYEISDAVSVEFFHRHFSNGNLTPINRAYNFTGLGMNFRF
jgi:hypothetical protein